MTTKTLSALHPGERAVIDSVEAPEKTRWKLLEMGLGAGETIRLIRKSPLGGPLEIEVMHYRLAMRRSEADKILVRPL